MKPVAIVGMAGIFPGAPDIAQYWRNIVDGVDAISEVPEQRWDKVFYDPESTAVDRFYCKRGGFVDDYVDFDPLQFGVMPKAAQSADPDQLLSLRVGVEAMRDAGYTTREFARERAGIVIGRGNYLSAGTLRLEQHVRHVQQTLQILGDLLPDIGAERLAQVRTQLQAQLDYYGPDVAVGMIPNLVASRLANRLDLHGPAYTVDAACASSLLAVEQSCQLLGSGDCDLMLAGGLHFTHDLTFWATFCQLGALSRSQQVKPFSRNADGILAGEGIGLVVLKRLVDAERDGDRIYAVIRGVGSASDGRGASLLAPAVEGQLLALRRAWQHTALDPRQIGLVEAHGTGTPTGDETELETLRRFFGAAEAAEAGDDRRAIIGSVKSMIGHTMPAAGVAGLIKAALSIYHGVLPPTLHCEEPHELIAQTRFRAIGRREPWCDATRIAAVNAFGFGGINAHVVLAQHSAEPVAQNRFVAAAGAGDERGDTDSRDEAAAVSAAALPRVAVIAAATQDELLDKLQREQWDTQSQPGDWRIAIIEPNAKRLELAKKVVSAGKAWHGRSQIYFSCDPLLSNAGRHSGRVAFLFPGVDSAFAPRAQDIARHFDLPLPPHCEELSPSDSLLKVVQGLSGFNQFTFAVLQKLGIRAHGMAGHSIGEWSAMAAGGMVEREQAEAVLQQIDPSAVQFPDLVFLAAACDRDLVRSILDGRDDVVMSHDNCPHQCIVCGKRDVIAEVEQRLREHSVLLQHLPIVSGFHTPFFGKYLAPYRDFFLQTPLLEPSIPIWSATTAQPFPTAMAQKQQLALDHLLQPVRFRPLLENMYAAGFRAFIQLGTGSLSGFVQDTLKGKPHLAIDVNSAKQTGMAQLCHLSAALWVEGLPFNTELLGLHAEAALKPQRASTIKLRLGVPLLHLSEPLQLEHAPAAPAFDIAAFAANGNDPIANLFRETLVDIQRAGAEVTQLWRSRAHRVSATAKTASGGGAQVIPLPPTPKTAAAEPAPAPTEPREHRIVKRLDIDDNIADVSDHAFYPQRPGWPEIADRHPVIPLTMEVALLRQAVEEYLPGYVVTRLENVKAYNWLIVSKPVAIEIILKRERPAQTGEPEQLEIAIEGYMSAHAIVARGYPLAPARRRNEWRNARPAAIDALALYRDNWMFHGPAYQGVIELGPIADNGIRGRLRTPRGSGSLLDNMGQLAGYWVMEQPTDCLAMPIGVEQINFYGGEPAVGSEFECEISVRALDQLSCITDQQLLDDAGNVVIEMNGWQTRRYQMDRKFWIDSKQLEKYIVSERLERDTVFFEDRYDTAILRDYIARRYLNRIEMAQYEALPPRRRRSWLNGRVAAKDAVRAYCWQHRGTFDFYPKEIRVDNAENGQPLLLAHISDTLAEPLHVSIAHKDACAVAAVSAVPVGVDVEVVAERAQEFIDLAFTPAERALLPTADRNAWIARFWAAKEAVAKMRGTGLQGKPKQFVVERVDGDSLSVDGVRVAISVRGDRVIAITCGPQEND